jgi:protein-disulfide isomerase/uncharacterized membrane protein YphA (DoxX/SURF4 family)
VTWNTLRPWLSSAVRVVLGAVWLWAGLSKLNSPRAFVQTVRAYDATPEWLSRAIGYGLPVLEICIGILLVVGVVVRLAAAVSAVLFLIFLIGVVQAAARGIKLECGCFSHGGLTVGATSYTLDILRDIVLLIAAVYLVVWSTTRISIEEFLARNDYVEPPSPKRMRSEGGQRKYTAAIQARRKAARERSLYLNSALSIVVLLVALIGVGVQSGRAKITGTTTGTNATAADGVVFGKKAAATVDVFEDFQCPHCQVFENAVHTVLEADVRTNRAQVRYHTLAFLDANSSGNRYSSRAANAALCVSDVSVDAFVRYHDILFSPGVQPAEGTKGRTDNQLIGYAQQAGLTAAQVTTFTTCIQGEQHKALVQAITDNASKRGVNSTPTVWVNGKSVTADLAALTTAIAAADAKGPAPVPSVTPSPTPTKPAASSTAKTTPAVKTPTPTKKTT